jgi:hypothetical protein
MTGPAKQKRAPAKSAPQKLPVHETYRFSLFVQAFNGRRAAIRRCAACDSHITNRNLGGNDGRSALSGPVWCLRCADYPRQRLLPLGRTL